MRPALTFALALFWVLLSAVPRMDVMELAKLPMLWAHYQQHAGGADEPVENFADFLQMHYGADHHSDGQEHGKLPFKAHQGCVALVGLPCSGTFTALEKKPMVVSLPTMAYPRLTVGKASRRPQGIWQPPKLV